MIYAIAFFPWLNKFLVHMIYAIVIQCIYHAMIINITYGEKIKKLCTWERSTEGDYTRTN